MSIQAKKITRNAVDNIKAMATITAPQSAVVAETQPKQFTQSTILVSPYVSQSERHLEEARMAMCLEETSKSVARFLSDLARLTERATNWNSVEWYEEQARNHTEWLARREAERKLALGIVSCSYPEEWRKLSNGKNALLKEIGSFLMTLCREHGKGDCYSITLEDLISLTPSFHKDGSPRSQDERGRMIVNAFSKFREPMVPVFDQFTGQAIRGAFTECRLTIERIEKTFDHVVYFNY